MPEITHTAIGWTRIGAWPIGFRPLHHRIRVGAGESAFQSLAQGILSFELHRLAGLRVIAAPQAAVGGTVTVGFGIGNLRLNAPCEVVWIDELSGTPARHDDGVVRAGFAYATLPGHPESGEESFVAEMDSEGVVFFDLRAYSRHGGWLYRAGAPVARSCQELVTRRYLAAAHRLAGGSHGPKRPSS
ncbi:DUF1990 domain-containing protein [Arthrobacter sp. JZ12]|uniref:DUF1990 family protein n=1 Tax=Arthrobacter sp. JZ12 TaxID=2654190 RepID=UPI002B4A7A3C|nr:DUF1990 domain-containing protein [Arthrobacter sp. JZ12]